MPDYEKMYHRMFGVVAEVEKITCGVLSMIENPAEFSISVAENRIWKAVYLLRAAQRECGQLHTETSDAPE